MLARMWLIDLLLCRHSPNRDDIIGDRVPALDPSRLIGIAATSIALARGEMKANKREKEESRPREESKQPTAGEGFTLRRAVQSPAGILKECVQRGGKERARARVCVCVCPRPS